MTWRIQADQRTESISSTDSLVARMTDSPKLGVLFTFLILCFNWLHTISIGFNTQ
jgi:hypothetical protein